MPLTHADDFRLTIHFWPRAAAASVRPQPFEGFTLDEDPALYRPHEIVFSHPPARDDFLAVVRQTPWMLTWGDDLMPLIANNAWPMVSPGYKAAHADLIDDKGRVVGRLDVSRSRRYCNAPYAVPFLGTYEGSDVDRLLKRRVRDKARREEAREHVLRNRNIILERVARGDGDDEALLAEVTRVLADGGYLKQRRPLPV